MDKNEEKNINIFHHKETIKKIIFILIWIMMIMIIAKNKDSITVENIVELSPSNQILAALVLLAIFAVKSISIILPCGVIYTAAGVLFSFPYALIVGILGTFIVVSLPYYLGRSSDKKIQEKIIKKYPKLKMVKEYAFESNYKSILKVRFMGLLPSDPLSFYYGMNLTKYTDYVKGSILAFSPTILSYTLLGCGIKSNDKIILKIAGIIEIIKIGIMAVVIVLNGKAIIKIRKNSVSEK